VDEWSSTDLVMVEAERRSRGTDMVGRRASYTRLQTAADASGWLP